MDVAIGKPKPPRAQAPRDQPVGKNQLRNDQDGQTLRTAMMKRNAISLGLIGAFFFAIALSAAPELHQRIHSDANRVEHTCAVTLITGGNYQHSVAAPITVSPASIVDLAIVPALNPAWVPSPFLGAHIFEHAPPRDS